jgi:NAD(P)-dependent dehydrogenase (short-subunit alcohol dehydrogenase family)
LGRLNRPGGAESQSHHRRALRRGNGDAAAQRDARRETRHPPHAPQDSGSIINNGSIAGRLAGFSSSVVYGAAKAAVIHLTKCVAMELGESGIRVNSISPGAIATGIVGKALGLSVEAAQKTPAVMREIFKTQQPIQRAGLPDDVAHASPSCFIPVHL